MKILETKAEGLGLGILGVLEMDRTKTPTPACNIGCQRGQCLI